jgi:hypothetical protein
MSVWRPIGRRRRRQPAVDRPVSSSLPRSVARVLLGAFLLYTGVSHLSFARTAFYAQVPPWLPLNADFVIISQFITHANAFGLDSDLARGIRLLFQPLLVFWALWSTGAWAAFRNRGS